ncbi:SDR family NAD(P)-dependent oxidoreductase [Aquimarina gracilis]|uniref:SDR family NAD(P)-dependent oxidoreductase n=1 Tax=Aquimarina gracilis TaxID=874422 RepID=A0ABU5ZTY4_9FLAO|nr:SDR family NAD(P)-dependent oxidoreductase [Aquimarina gracilis]MEB3345108.1 SDR family NAD(P)-dependent oxidoreductase [Aquimarina gracilis]
MSKSIIIIGAGPGIGLEVARRFGKEGYEIGLISRTEEKLKKYQKELESEGYKVAIAAADAGKRKQLRKAIKEVQSHLATTNVLHYNAVAFSQNPLLSTKYNDIINDLKVGVFNAVESIKSVLPALKDSKGTVLLTGGGFADYPSAEFGTISLSKSSIRHISKQLNEALNNDNVFVGSLQINGMVKSHKEDEKYNPVAIANAFWALSQERDTPNKVY